jgi:stage V sporulation protein G
MNVTEVKIKLVPPTADSKLLAFASLTLDNCFVVRDIKVIMGNKTLFVAMPSRKITDHCKKCRAKNHLQALYCNQCGTRLPERRIRPDERGRARLHADIAHPINAKCRQDVQEAILKEYYAELERSKHPGYVPTAFDDFDAGPEEEHVFEQPNFLKGAESSGTAAAVQGPGWGTEPKRTTKRDDSGGFGILG